MKEMTFKVSSPKENALLSIIKQVNKMPCRFTFDLTQGFIVLGNVDDNLIDNVIDLINNNYTIEEVYINNTSESIVEIPIFEKVEEQTSTEAEEPLREEGTESFNSKTKTEVLPESAEFHNENINNAINKLLKNVSWFMEKKDASERDVLGHIYTCMNEMSMRFAPKRNVQFSVGDIVECYYGSHLSGEVNGKQVHGLVCDIQNEFMAYVVPIFRISESEVSAKSYLKCTIPNDLVYSEEADWESVAILERGRFLRTERVNKVIGRATPEFFAKVLQKLAYSTFDFTQNILEENEVNCDGQLTQIIENPTTESINIIEEKTVEETSPIVAKRRRKKSEELTTPKVGGEEEAILEVIGSALDKLDKSKPVSEQVEDFMAEIGIPSTSATWLVKQSFEVACDIKKINYENVILELHNLNPNIKEEIIKASLKENFKKWLEKYPQVAEKCSKISLMSLLKVFAKRFA